MTPLEAWVTRGLSAAIVANLPSRERCADVAARAARAAAVALHKTLTLLATGNAEEKR